MSPVGRIVQLGISGVLTLAPAAIFYKDRLKIAIALSFLAIHAGNYVGGLLLSVPIALILLVFALWLHYVGHADSGPKRVLFVITVILTALFVMLQVGHLPIRFMLEQKAARIAANVAGIILGSALLGASLEMWWVKRAMKSPDGTPDSISQAVQVTERGEAASREDG